MTSEGSIENVCIGSKVDQGGRVYWTKYVRDCASERISEDEMKLHFQNGYLFGFIQRFL